MLNNYSAAQSIEQLADSLVRLCHEQGVFPPDVDFCDPNDDLIEGGLIDSMSLVYMQAVIQEKFSVELEPELFIVELRNIHAIAAYLAQQLPIDRIENSDVFDTCKTPLLEGIKTYE